MRVLLATRDLIFRSKLGAVVQAGGGEITRHESTCDVAVIEIGADSEARIRRLVAGRIRVLAFGSHVEVEALRAAREAGAVAVPNSQVEGKLRQLLVTST